MLKKFVVLLFTLVSLTGFGNDLVKYYNGEIQLSESAIDSLCNQILLSSTNTYLRALSYYQKGVSFRSNGNDLEAYAQYDLALEHLIAADTMDTFLLSAILRNQGVIMYDYQLFEHAAQKHEEALPFAYEYSKSRGTSIKYGLGWALAKHDQNRALDVLKEVIEEAYDLNDKNRSGQSFMEVSKILNALGDYEKALEFNDEAVLHVSSDQILAQIYHSRSHTYYLMKSYRLQQTFLIKSLSLRKGKERYLSLVDLGESYLITGDTLLAKSTLKEALQWYDEQLLHPDNFKLFEWLYQADMNNQTYLIRQVKEMNNYIDTSKMLERTFKKQAMFQFLLRLEKQKEMDDEIFLYRTLTRIMIGLIALTFGAMIFTYFYFKKMDKKNTLMRALAERTKSTMKLN